MVVSDGSKVRSMNRIVGGACPEDDHQHRTSIRARTLEGRLKRSPEGCPRRFFRCYAVSQVVGGHPYNLI